MKIIRNLRFETFLIAFFFLASAGLGTLAIFAEDKWGVMVAISGAIFMLIMGIKMTNMILDDMKTIGKWEQLMDDITHLRN